jgi:hypothetical protein
MTKKKKFYNIFVKVEIEDRGRDRKSENRTPTHRFEHDHRKSDSG